MITHRILIVEDNPDDAEILQETLASEPSANFRTTRVDRLGSALDLIRGGDTFAAVLLDLSLPDSQGVGSVSILREAAPEMALIVCTGYDDDAAGFHALKAGAQAYIVKGTIDPGELTRTLSVAIQHAEALTANDFLTGLTSLLVRLSGEFVRASGGQVSSLIPEALGHLAEFLGMERAYICLREDQNTGGSPRFHWISATARALPKRALLAPHSAPWIAKRAEAGETVFVSSPEELPDAAAEERAIFESEGLLAMIAEPLFSDDGFIGILFFDTSKTLSSWPHALEQSMHTVANTFSAALRRINAEKALVQSESRYRNLFNLMIAGLAEMEAIYDKQGGVRDFRFLRVNPRFERMLRRPAGEIVGKTVHELMPNPTPLFLDNFRKVIQTGESRSFQGAAAGSGRIYEVDVVLYEQHRIAATFSDITERVEASRRNSMLASALEQIGDAVQITDAGGLVLYVNRAFIELTGYPIDELVGQSANVHKSDLHPPEFFKELWACVRKGEPWAGRFHNRRKDGSTYTKDSVISPVMDETGKIVYLVDVGRDVTEQLRREEVLRQSQKLEALATLTGGIAHDFNNILSAIIGYTEFVQAEMEEGTQAHEDLGQVLTAGLRARDLVQHILNFSRKSDPKLQPVPFNSLVKETIKLLRASFPSTIEIRSDLGQADYQVIGDPTQLQQVVMNICTNAFQAMEDEGGVLSVKLDSIEIDALSEFALPNLKSGPYIQLVISDSGHGIPGPVRERIFEPFFTTKSQGEGTGLGLSTSLGIVQSHGGTITVYSEENQGTTFHIYLPSMEHTSAALPPSILVQVEGQGRHVLLVDDESDVVKVHTRMLEKLGFKVTSWIDPLAALDAFEQAPDRFDLLLTDQTMPKLSGPDLARRVRAIRPDLRIVMATGFQSSRDEESVDPIPVDIVLSKPVIYHELNSALLELLSTNPTDAPEIGKASTGKSTMAK